MELFAPGGRKFEFDSYTKVQNEIKIQKAFLNFIPYNEVFYVIASARFFNKQNPAEYQWLSVAYKLRWATSLDLKFGATAMGVATGKDLFVDASDVSVVNSEAADAILKDLKWVWLCPQDLDCSALDQKSTDFKIKNAQIEEVGIANMVTYHFVLNIRPRYSQPNSDSPYLQRIFSATWLGPP